MGQQGHTTDDCRELKKKVQDVIEADPVQLYLLESSDTIGYPLPSVEDSGMITGLGKAVDQKQSCMIQVKPKGEPNENLKRKIAALAERAKTLEWIMKFVVNEIQHMNPAIGKAPNHESSGPIDKIECSKEKQRPSLPIQKTLSQGKPNQQTP